MAEQEILSCPMPKCGGACEMSYKSLRAINRVRCFDCGYETGVYDTPAQAIAEHNAVSRACSGGEGLRERVQELEAVVANLLVYGDPRCAVFLRGDCKESQTRWRNNGAKMFSLLTSLPIRYTMLADD